MADEVKKGDWVARGTGKWHYIESLIEDRAVTHCGRQMRRTAKSGSLMVFPGVTPVPGVHDTCSRCEGS